MQVFHNRNAQFSLSPSAPLSLVHICMQLMPLKQSVFVSPQIAEAFVLKENCILLICLRGGMKLFFELFFTILEYHYVSNDNSKEILKSESLWLIIHN